jgi:uncharacterized protein (TIGR00730 family)
LGRLLATEGIELVYGGGGIGLMGVLADSVLSHGGRVTGVVPRALSTKEVAHSALTRMEVVGSMHERKALMASLSDAFIAMPGGYGTFEELLESVTWAQLGIQAKPVGVLNVNRYYDPLIQLIDNAVNNGFIRPQNRNLIVTAESAEPLLRRLLERRLP